MRQLCPVEAVAEPAAREVLAVSPVGVREVKGGQTVGQSNAN